MEKNVTIIPNNILERVNDIELIGAWVYLFYVKDRQKITKDVLKDRFKLTEYRVNTIFKTLAEHHLIEYVSKKTESGRFDGNEIMIIEI